MTVSRTLLPAALAGMVGLGQGMSAGLPVRVECGRMLAKALPAVEGGERVVYFTAANEGRDWQGESILTQALTRSIPYFLRHGRIDLDHGSVVDRTGKPMGEIRGRRVDDPYLYEIGRPVEARPGPDGLVQVKAQIFRGAPENPWVAMADVFWGSLQSLPPTLWYPSVQGLVTNELGVVAPDGLPTQQVRDMLWQSAAFSRTPVGRDLPEVTTVPLRIFAKALQSSKGINQVLSELGGLIPPAPAVEAPGELSGAITTEIAFRVLDALTQAPKGQPPAEFLQAMEKDGIPQDHALAVLLALLGS